MEQSIVSGYTDSTEGNYWATLAKDVPFVPTMQVHCKIAERPATRIILQLLKILLILRVFENQAVQSSGNKIFLRLTSFTIPYVSAIGQCILETYIVGLEAIVHPSHNHHWILNPGLPRA